MAVGPVLASAGGKGKYRRRVQTAILLPFNIIIKSNLTFVRTRYYEKPNLLVGKLYQRIYLLQNYLIGLGGIDFDRDLRDSKPQKLAGRIFFSKNKKIKTPAQRIHAELNRPNE